MSYRSQYYNTGYSGKKIVRNIVTTGTAIITLAVGGYSLYKSSPYNGNVVYYNNQKSITTKVNDLIYDGATLYNDFTRFETLMYDFANDRYTDYNRWDVDYLFECIDGAVEGGLSEYEKSFLKDGIFRDSISDGFSINFQNYFKKDTPEYEMVRRFVVYHQDIVTAICRNKRESSERLINDCCSLYEYSAKEISKLHPLARVIILKIAHFSYSNNNFVESDRVSLAYGGMSRQQYNSIKIRDIESEIMVCENNLESYVSGLSRR